jgi:hypothetical protein
MQYATIATVVSIHSFDTCMDTRALLNLLWSTCRSRLDNPLQMLSHNLIAHEMRGGKCKWQTTAGEL